MDIHTVEEPAPTSEADAPAPAPAPALPLPKRRLGLVLVVGAVLGALLAAVVLTAGDGEGERALPEPTVEPMVGRVAAEWGLAPYESFGTWVDLFDFVPGYDGGTAPPAIGPEHLEAMAGFGVRTLYLQVAGGQSLEVVDPELVGRFLATAHGLDMAVVAWYLPFLSEPASDLARLRAITEFEAQGHRFDGLAVDIEWTQGVPDPAERSRRLVELSEQLDELTGAGVIGAITPPPAQLEDVNPAFWPGFPWAELGRSYDVFLPMAYWSERLPPWDDPFLLTAHSVTRLRALVGDPRLPVHVIGGVADASPEHHYPAFLDAAEEQDAIGVSVYDFRSITIGGMARLSTTSTVATTTSTVPATRS